MNEKALNLRDIHLPEPISWWPPAPGWWILLITLILLAAILFVTRKIYLSKQLKRDIISELENIKQQFQQSQNKSQLAKSLSILLRRASISYYPTNSAAGLTGNNWLSWLDKTNTQSSNNLSGNQFQSDIGKILLTAPYLPDKARLDFDSDTLTQLCETWLLSSHKSQSHKRTSRAQFS